MRGRIIVSINFNHTIFQYISKIFGDFKLALKWQAADNFGKREGMLQDVCDREIDQFETLSTLNPVDAIFLKPISLHFKLARVCLGYAYLKPRVQTSNFHDTSAHRGRSSVVAPISDVSRGRTLPLQLHLYRTSYEKGKCSFPQES